MDLIVSVPEFSYLLSMLYKCKQDPRQYNLRNYLLAKCYHFGKYDQCLLHVIRITQTL